MFLDFVFRTCLPLLEEIHLFSPQHRLLLDNFPSPPFPIITEELTSTDFFFDHEHYEDFLFSVWSQNPNLPTLTSTSPSRHPHPLQTPPAFPLSLLAIYLCTLSVPSFLPLNFLNPHHPFWAPFDCTLCTDFFIFILCSDLGFILIY